MYSPWLKRYNREMLGMGSEKVLRWNDAHFCSLSSQTNIYGLQKIKAENDTYKLLVSSLDSSFLSVEYQKIDDKIAPSTKCIQFTHIPVPGDAEIVSINVFKRLPPKKGLVVGITYVMPQEQEAKPKNQVLNIYSAALTEDEVDEASWKRNTLEIVADNCDSKCLTFVPFILTHTEVFVESGRTENVFLLAGSDHTIHIYKEMPGVKLNFKEIPSEIFFPEYNDFHCNILQIEVTKPDPVQRLTALGFEDGTVRVHLVNKKKLEVLMSWRTTMDSPVTSLHFFTQQKFVPLPSCLENTQDDASQCSTTEEDPLPSQISLLLTTALQPAVVYRDVLNSGLSDYLCLPDSEKYDCAMCSLAADIDFDGQHELLVGTYGQELLVYKFFPTVEKLIPISSSIASAGTSSIHPSAQKSLTETSTSSEQAEEAGKQRHKSDESNIPEKSQSQQRKVKSQEDLFWLTGDKCQELSALPEMKADPLEMRIVPEPHYKLLWQRSFPCPIMALDSAEMMGDGVENLVVLTTHGLHILQPDLHEVAKLLTHRLQQLCLSGPEVSDEFHRLQTE